MLQAVLTGLFLGIGFVIPALSAVGIIGVILFLITVVQSNSVRRVISFGVVTWSIKMLLVFSWGFSIYPIDWIATHSPITQIFFILLYAALSSVVIGLGGGICTYILFKLRQYLVVCVPLTLIIIPTTWLLSEISGSLLFSIFFLGPGISPNVSFSFGYVGYLAGAWTLLLPLAILGGVYSLGFVLMFCSTLLFLFLEKRIKRTYGLAGCLLVLSLIVLTQRFGGWVMVPISATNIAVVSTFFDSLFETMDEFGELKRQNLEAAVTAANGLSADYIILPEDSRYLQSQFGDKLQGLNVLNAYRFTGGDPNKMLIDSSRVDTNPGEVVLRAFLLDGQNNHVIEFDKQYLLPQGEFMPYSMQFLFELAGYKEAVALQAVDSAYRPGPKLQIGSIPTNIPAVLFCSEAIDPLGVAKIIKNRTVPFVANPVSHAWFHNSKILSAQVDTMLRIQAVMNSVYIVSAGNMEASKVYAPTGVVTVGDVVDAGEYWNVAIVSIP